MKNIIFIGTLHAGLTPFGELQETLEYYKPEQLLVEISQSDIENNNLKTCPDEMRFALLWAIKNSIPVFGFDVSFSVLVKGKTEKDNLLVIKEQKKVMERYSWKEANTSRVSKDLNIPQLRVLVDQKKESEREQKMLENIRNVMFSNKRIVVLTGVGHLHFFEQYFPDALFPFR